MFIRRVEYFVVAALFAVLAIVSAVVMALSLDTGIVAPGRRALNKSDDIVARAGALVSVSDSEVKIAKSRVSDGLVSCGDYVISVMTSPDYLLNGVSDDRFAEDLCNVVFGEVKQNEKNDVLDYLKKHNRMETIDRMIASENKSLRASGKIAEKGSTVSDVSLESTIDSTEQYTVGIRESKGSYTATGDEVRTDFFVDGSLYYGYMKFTNDKNNYREFVLSWDTADCDPGRHKVYALLRSSDGRGTVISGGEITIPEKTTIAPGSVHETSIPEGEQTSWYMIDCGEENCYIDFAGLSDDIRVSLYNLKGELVGTNENPGIPYAMLRGKKQDVDSVIQETGISSVSNCFYVCVSRAGSEGDSEKAVNFTMIQARDCAYFDGAYMAVTSDDGSGKVKLTDMANNTYEVEKEKAGILPINGTLSGLIVADSVSAKSLDIYPKFDFLTRDYAYYADDTQGLAFRCVALEGYSADISIVADIDGEERTIDQGEIFSLPYGETLVTLTVTSFDGYSDSYRFYLLKGNDSGDFYENTLSKFPESYYSGLWLLHSLRPNYVFKPYYTNLSFGSVVDAEDSYGRSLIQKSSHASYVKPNSKVYDKPDWMAAKPEVISYFLDPRNFFTPEKIFQFELLGFDPNIHTVQGVKEIIKGSFMDGSPDYDYARIIYEAGKEAGVSPYFLASRIIQEMGYKGESALSRGDLTGYEGYYNYYNIGAYATTEKGGAVINGAKYAQWGKDPDGKEITESEAAFLLPWTSVEKAIKGGALWIASGYIDRGQNTLYFQKFDVLDDGTDKYNHQYAQNIMMAYSEGLRYYRSYRAINMTDNGFEFIIPVYNNMPDSYGRLP